MKPTVNLGCGIDPWGDVRVDVGRFGKPDIVMDLNSTPWPFKDREFSEARLFHVLEHVRNPQRVLSEACRIAETVHAKFPAEHDRVPDVLKLWTELHIFTAMRHMGYKLFQIFNIEHPQRHRWMIQPFGKYQKNRVRIPSCFLQGPKSRYLSRFAIPLHNEWECWVYTRESKSRSTFEEGVSARSMF